MSPPGLFSRKPYHDSERQSHYPSCGARTGQKICSDEAHEACLCPDCKSCEVDHVCDNVNECEDNNGPAYCLVPRDILVKRYDAIQGCSSQKTDEIATDRYENERY